MDGLLKNKKYGLIVIVFLIFFSLLSGISAAEESSNRKKMNKILENADEILTAEANVTTATQLLAALPEAEQKKKIAVYNIDDKTGQIKDSGATLVTQGATDMMITALKRSRQFRVLDRVNFNDFMNEQNLKTKDRLKGKQGPAIGEMTGAQYLISGAVTEYQVDKKTGGLGLSIAGVGGTTETAVDLRVVDTTTGEVIWAKSLRKEIKGKRVGLQTFSFIGDNMVEFETGEGKQEVINLVVRTLIEEAVFELVESGVLN